MDISAEYQMKKLGRGRKHTFQKLQKADSKVDIEPTVNKIKLNKPVHKKIKQVKIEDASKVIDKVPEINKLNNEITKGNIKKEENSEDTENEKTKTNQEIKLVHEKLLNGNNEPEILKETQHIIEDNKGFTEENPEILVNGDKFILEDQVSEPKLNVETKTDISNEKSDTFSLDSIEIDCINAAVKIQSLWRGFKTRKANKLVLNKVSEETIIPKESMSSEEDVIHIPLKGPLPEEILNRNVAKVAQMNGPTPDSPEYIYIPLKTPQKDKDEKFEVDTQSEASKVEDESKVEMDEEAAALKIQSTWRGHNVRKNKTSTTELAPEEIIDVVNEDEVKNSINVEQKPEMNEEAAALKIQSTWRGHNVRKNQKVVSDEVETLSAVEEPKERITEPFDAKESKEEMDEEAAALKIQSSWRGHNVRKNKRSIATKLDNVENGMMIPSAPEAHLVLGEESTDLLNGFQEDELNKKMEDNATEESIQSNDNKPSSDETEDELIARKIIEAHESDLQSSEDSNGREDEKLLCSDEILETTSKSPKPKLVKTKTIQPMQSYEEDFEADVEDGKAIEEHAVVDGLEKIIEEDIPKIKMEEDSPKLTNEKNTEENLNDGSPKLDNESVTQAEEAVVDESKPETETEYIHIPLKGPLPEEILTKTDAPDMESTNISPEYIHIPLKTPSTEIPPEDSPALKSKCGVTYEIPDGATLENDSLIIVDTDEIGKKTDLMKEIKSRREEELRTPVEDESAEENEKAKPKVSKEDLAEVEKKEEISKKSLANVDGASPSKQDEGNDEKNPENNSKEESNGEEVEKQDATKLLPLTNDDIFPLEKTILQEEKDKIVESPDVPTTVVQAAIKIQSLWRGFKIRRKTSGKQEVDEVKIR